MPSSLQFEYHSLFKNLHLKICFLRQLHRHPAHSAYTFIYSFSQALEVEFNTGEHFKYPAEFLRVESPAANTSHSFIKKPSSSKSTLPQVVHGRRYVGILGVEPVGRYALRIDFDDLHNTGIYSWPFLYRLGNEKYKRMRQYIKLLKQQGLSRDPRPLRRVVDKMKGT